jgi:hypothetical protein
LTWILVTLCNTTQVAVPPLVAADYHNDGTSQGFFSIQSFTRGFRERRRVAAMMPL